MLVYIALEMDNRRYGTFLGLHEQMRVDLKLKDETESMWTYIMNNRERFLNPNYNEEMNIQQNNGIINHIPMTDHLCLTEWREYFFRYTEWAYPDGIPKEKKSKKPESLNTGV